MDKQKIIKGLRAVQTARNVMTDAQAAECPALYPEWDGNGKSYKAGDRLSRNGVLYKVKQDHVSQADWLPENLPALYAKILPGQDGTEIGAWEQPIGDTNPYMTGDRVTHNGKTWESTVDNNVWKPGAPGVYTWVEVTEG